VTFNIEKKLKRLKQLMLSKQKGESENNPINEAIDGI
jgi:hypothetical protein